MTNKPITFLSPNKHSYSVKFSPFLPNILGLVSNDNFGFAGGGKLSILNLSETSIQIYKEFEWQCNLFDIVFSENNENICVTSSANGTLQIWDIAQGECVQILQEHKQEVHCIDWSKNRLDQKLLSGSWDGSIKIWDIHKTSSIFTINDNCIIHCVSLSPLLNNVFASTSNDGHVKIYNEQNAISYFQAHDGDVLCLDWSKYEKDVIATGGSDGFIRFWDIRQLKQPILQLIGSEQPLKRILFSPYSNSVIASVGFDFTTKIFDASKAVHAIEMSKNHSEFVFGLDWSNFNKNQIADCSWDGFVNVFTAQKV